MSTRTYQTILYEPELKRPVAEVLKGLWGNDIVENLRLFEWKYEENPFAQEPLGVVVLHGREVVGFRGYHPHHFTIAGSGEVISILMAGDTCVSPDHRLKGLSVTMGKMAAREYARDHSLFMNMSCSAQSLPGYRRLGYLPIAERVSLTRASPINVVKGLWADPSYVPIEQSGVQFGRFDSIEVKERPESEAMAELVRKNQTNRSKIQLAQNEQFFSWRFQNPRREYVFYYSWSGTQLTGYAVIGTSANKRIGYILDINQTNDSSFTKIMKHIIDERHFDVLSTLDFHLDESTISAARALGFSYPGIAKTFRHRLRSPKLPILVRPVQKKYSGDDLFFRDLDIRDFFNWSLKPIYSDGE